MTDWLSGARYRASNPVMVGFVSSIPTMVLKLFKTLDVNIVQKCQFCAENENLDSTTSLIVPSADVVVIQVFL